MTALEKKKERVSYTTLSGGRIYLDRHQPKLSWRLNKRWFVVMVLRGELVVLFRFSA